MISGTVLATGMTWDQDYTGEAILEVEFRGYYQHGDDTDIRIREMTAQFVIDAVNLQADRLSSLYLDFKSGKAIQILIGEPPYTQDSVKG